MKIEHTAINISNPEEFAKWYVDNLGLRIVFRLEESPNTHFLADDKGMMIEIYNNTQAPVPDYKSMHPLILHLAFISKNPEEDKKRLEKSGATYQEEVKLPDGTHLVMMRDPWGLAIQFCKRATPLI